MFLLVSYYSHVKGLNVLRNLFLLLYLTSILYWYKLDDNSIRKYLDQFVCIIILSYYTFYETKKLSNERKISCIINVLIHIITFHILSSIIFIYILNSNN